MDVFGLPLHPLVVHAAVVLVPLAAIAAIVVTMWPRARTRYGWLAAAFCVAGAAAAVTARLSGPALMATLGGGSGLARAHSAWGLLAPWPAVLLALSLPALLVLDRRRERSRSRVGFWVAAALTVVAALAALVLMVLTGHSGAVAVWGGLLG